MWIIRTIYLKISYDSNQKCIVINEYANYPSATLTLERDGLLCKIVTKIIARYTYIYRCELGMYCTVIYSNENTMKNYL